MPPFGVIMGDPDLLDCYSNAPYIKYSSLGLCIIRGIKELQTHYRDVQIKVFAIMPDHVHLIVYLKPGNITHLGFIIASLKNIVSSVFSKEMMYPGSDGEYISVFEEKYTDRIIYDNRQLIAEIKYVKDNPRRRQMLAKYPDYYRRNIRYVISDIHLVGFGNQFLLTHPSRYAVKVRSAWTDEEFSKYRENCGEMTRQGMIAVSPFISRREKIIRDDIIATGGRMIRISSEQFSSHYKPMGREFELCGAGRLLLLAEDSSALYAPRLKRQQAMRLNDIAEMLALY